MKKLPLMMVLKGDIEYDAESDAAKTLFTKLFTKTEELNDEEKKLWDKSLYVNSLFTAALFFIKAISKEIKDSGIPMSEQVDIYMQLMEAITTQPVFQMLAQFEALSAPAESGMLN